MTVPLRAATVGTMYCQRCCYLLSGVTSGACPECGRQFHPDDAASYDVKPGNSRRKWMASAVAGWTIGASYAALLALSIPNFLFRSSIFSGIWFFAAILGLFAVGGGLVALVVYTVLWLRSSRRSFVELARATLPWALLAVLYVPVGVALGTSLAHWESRYCVYVRNESDDAAESVMITGQAEVNVGSLTAGEEASVRFWLMPAGDDLHIRVITAGRTFTALLQGNEPPTVAGADFEVVITDAGVEVVDVHR